MAMPKSAVEQQSALAYLRSQPWNDQPVDKVWLGARFHEGRWNWGDGSEVCGYTNWKAGHGHTTMTAQENRWMCLVKATGMWEECNAGTDDYQILCENKPPAQLCKDGALSGIDMALTVDPGMSAIEYHGYCFYLGQTEENCEVTCARQMQGTC